MTPRLLIKVPSNPSNNQSIDVSHLVIEDDKPVDNLHSAQQQRLLVVVLYDSDTLPHPFLAETNVGLFYDINEDPIVPDMLLSLGVQRAEDYSQKKNRSYFVWEMGKLPEVCVEIVSNREGDEVNLSRKSIRQGKTTSKKDRYAQIGIKYYIVCDPLERIQSEMGYAKAKVWTLSPEGDYPEELAQSIHNIGDVIWLEEIGLGMTLWFGEYEQQLGRAWFRWCDAEGNIYLTGAERARLTARQLEEEKFRAEEERFRAEEERFRAEEERLRAESAENRAESAEIKAQILADRLRELGIDPDHL
jgi:Uma2 family endonuclease